MFYLTIYRRLSDNLIGELLGFRTIGEGGNRVALAIEPHSPGAVAVASVGFASFSLWGFLFLNILIGTDAAVGASLIHERLVFSVGYICVLLLASFFTHVVIPLKPANNVAFLVLAVMGILGASFSNLAPEAAIVLKIAGALFAGVEYGWQLLFWSELFGYVKSRCASFCFACAFVIIAISCNVLFSLPVAAQAIIACALAICSPICIGIGSRIIRNLDAYKTSGRRIKKLKMRIREWRPRAPWNASELFGIARRPLITAMFFSFIFGLVDIEYGKLLFWAIGFGLLGIYLLVAIHFFSHRALVRFTYRVALMCMSLGLIALPYNPEIGGILVAFAYSAVLMLVIITLCEIANRFETSVVSLSGFVFGGSFLASAIGKVVGVMVIGRLSIYDPATTLLTSISLAVLVAYMVFGSSDGGFVFEFSRDNAVASDTNAELTSEDQALRQDPHDIAVSEAIVKEAIARRCEIVASNNGLSNREREVLEQIMLGDSIQAVAEKLFISPGTVKTHINHIYKKTGVEGRRELKELVDSAR